MNANGKQKTNLEKLTEFAEVEAPELIPLFITLLEMCFQSEEHSFQKL